MLIYDITTNFRYSLKMSADFKILIVVGLFALAIDLLSSIVQFIKAFYKV